MDINQFFQRVTDYYGEAGNKAVFDVTNTYVSKSFEDKSLPHLLSALYKTQKAAWGFPCVASMEIASDKFSKQIKTDLKTKKEKDYFQKDDSLTDEEWQKGFEGLEAVKKVVNSEFKNKANEKTIRKIDPEKMKEIKEDLKKENMK